MSEPIKEKLQKLHLAYTRALPDKIKAIELEWAALLLKWDAHKFVDFHRTVHSFSGSTATYGFKLLSDASRETECYLKDLLEATVISEEHKAKITGLLDTLKNTLYKECDVTATTNQHEVDKEIALQRILPHHDLVPYDYSKFIYIMESDSTVIREIAAHLNDEHYQVHTINNIQELEAAVHKNPPCALIVDIDHAGSVDIKRLKEIHTSLSIHIPLYCLAENGDILTRLQAIRAGGSAFFSKPIDAYSLAKLLNQACGTSQVEPYRVLIVDDSASLAEYYALVLGEAGLNTYSVQNPVHIIEAIGEFQPDLILMDVYMPGCTGIELAAILRQEPQYLHIPIIFLSTENDRYTQLNALNLGGDDFLTKPIDPQHLIDAISFRVKRAGILASYMTKDSLTGLLNHSNIMQRLELEIEKSKREHREFAFVMVDIDHFKSINDNYGHPVGDKVIRKLSTYLEMALRKTDIVGRYGGEEFAIILPGANAKKAAEICNSLRYAFSQIAFGTEVHPFTVSFSAGIACYPSISDRKQLVDAADQALYLAKEAGRNQVVIFHAQAPITVG